MCMVMKFLFLNSGSEKEMKEGRKESKRLRKEGSDKGNGSIGGRCR